MALSRTVASLAVLKRSKCYQILLCNRPEENVKVLIDFLERQTEPNRLSNQQKPVTPPPEADIGFNQRALML